MRKKLGIFCAGMNQQEFNTAVQDSLHPDIFYHAEIVHCGGKLNFDKISLIDKITVKRKLGITESIEIKKDVEMKAFIEWVNK